jgi:hypothetical protein
MKDQASKHWIIVGESSLGASHQKNNTPCQDAHFYQILSNDWGVAAVADGAGSVEKAHIGSKFLAENAGRIFINLIHNQQWEKQLPQEEEWQTLSKQGFAQLRQSLETFAFSQNLSAKDLSSTLMLVVFSPFGLMAVHIGDGRAGYLSQDDTWKALIEPWKGEYANETVFLSSDIWDKESINQYLKTSMVTEKVKAFTLLSDGCERHSFICNVLDEASQKYIDPNQPFDKFFNPLVANLRKMHSNQISSQEMKEKWGKFLREGNAKLQHEPDDKTMILAVWQEA